MANVGITYGGVVAAADVLTARGEPPTIRAVRAELGNTGSLSTIRTHLAKWRDSQRQAREEAETLPDEVLATMRQAIAQARTAGRAETEALLAQAQSESGLLVDDLERLEAERDDAVAQQHSAQAERDEARGALAEASREIHRLRSDLERERAGAETARVDAAELRARLATVTEQRDDARETSRLAQEQRDAVQAQAQEARQAAAVADAEGRAAQEQLAALREDLAAARDAIKQATEDHRAEVKALREQSRADLAKAQERAENLVGHLRAPAGREGEGPGSPKKRSDA